MSDWLASPQMIDDYIEREEEIYEEPTCPICGEILEPVSCWQCHGAGSFDLFFEDPLWYDNGDEEICSECHGEGKLYQCPNSPHSAAQHGHQADVGQSAGVQSEGA